MSKRELSGIALRLARWVFGQRLISNEYRGAFVEAMIEPHIKPYGWEYVGDGWSGWDFQHRGGYRLEIKQSTAQQTWPSPRSGRTRTVFDIAARKGYYEGGTDYVARSGRSAQTYVFAWNGFQDDPKKGLTEADHPNPDQWEFYVIPTSSLPEAQKTIGLAKIQKLTVPVSLPQLGAAINHVTVPQPPVSN